MATVTPSLPRWHSHGAPKSTSEALILSVCDGDGLLAAAHFAERWAAIVPRSAFAAFQMDLASRKIMFAPIQKMVQQEAGKIGLALSQIVLVGFGPAGLRALDLAICNALSDVHVIAVDLPPSSSVGVGLPPARGAFRFVQHRRADDPDGKHFDHTIHLLRDACLDIRTMVLPDGPDPTDRAIGSFLVELVARASRYQPTVRREPGGPLQSEGQA